MAPSVAVIMPVYNRAGMVAQALTSILDQTQTAAKLIVVDDGSTDGSRAAIDACLKARPPAFACEVIHQRNRGAGAARNRAIAAAGPVDLFAFLDSDDLWPDDYLARMTAALGADPAIIAASCDHEELGAQSGHRQLISSQIYEGNITETIFQGQMPLPSFTVARAEAVRQAGGFNESYRQGLEDVELFLRMSTMGGWRWVQGLPVTRRIDSQPVYGGAAQLSQQHLLREDSVGATLEVLDRFIYELGGDRFVRPELWKTRIAGLWRVLCECRLLQGRYREADRCLALWHRREHGRPAADLWEVWRTVARQYRMFGRRDLASAAMRRLWRRKPWRLSDLRRARQWLKSKPTSEAPGTG